MKVNIMIRKKIIHLQMNKPNPNCTFIDIKYKEKSYDAYIDTGATLCFASAKIPFQWNKLKKPLIISIADGSKHLIWKASFFNKIKIQNYIFIIPSIYQQESRLSIIIGNNFLKLYQPFCQYLHHIELTAPSYKNQETTVIKIPILVKLNKL